MGPVFADLAAAEPAVAAMSVPLPMPGLVIHGARDGCIGADLIPPMRDYFPAGLRVEIVPGAGHFVHQEAPAIVNRLVLDFLRA
jgi:pimeloyl-ACP methyl ester carboxylesterase